MTTINTDASTPPPTVLMLELLKQLTTNDNPPQPLNQGYGSTNVINTSGIATFFTQMHPSEALSLLTLAGQMLWRYIPLLTEVPAEVGAAAALGVGLLMDTNERDAYISKRGLARRLPDGTSFLTLRKLIDKLPNARDAIRKANLQAIRQRTTTGLTQRSRVYAPVYNPLVLTDYITVQRRQGYQRGRSTMLHVNPTLARSDRTSTFNRNVRNNTRWSNAGVSVRTNGAVTVARPFPYSDQHTRVLDHADSSNYSPLAFLTSLKNAVQPRRYIVSDRVCDHSTSIFKSDGNIRNGVFFRTPLFVARLAPISGNTFGYVDLNTRPFEITLNSGMAYPRVEMSFVHEVLHVLMEMHKVDLPHETLHELALMITNDLMPGVSALAKWSNQAQ